MNTYTLLKAAVASWIDRDDLVSTIPSLITMGESRIYRDLRVAAMETAISETITAGVIAVPSGYIELKNAYIDGKFSLTRVNPEFIYTRYRERSGSGPPLYVAREGANFIFGPYADSAYTMKGIYYKRLAALSTSNETNWFTDNCPELLLFAALAEAEPFIGNDERVVLWESKYQSVMKAVQKDNDREAFSGSRLQTVAG